MPVITPALTLGQAESGSGAPAIVAPIAPAAPANPLFNPSTYTPQPTADDTALSSAEGADANAAALPDTPNSDDRSAAASEFQSEIDALNQVYAEQKQAAVTQGLNNLGSDAAIQARRGLIGSTFGSAETDNVNTANANAQAAIDSKHNTDLAGVYANIDKAAQDAATQRVSAAQKGADATVANIKNRMATTTANVTNAVNSYLAAGNDGSKLTQQNINDWASTLGTTPEVVQNAVQAAIQAKQTATANANKTTLDTSLDEANIEKIKADVASGQLDASKPISVGGYIYTPDGKGGYTNSGPDNTKPTAADAASTAVSKFSSAFVPGAKLPDGTPVLDANGFITPVAFKAAVADAPAEGLTRQQFIQNFGYLLYGQDLSSYGLTPAEQKLVTGALPS